MAFLFCVAMVENVLRLPKQRAAVQHDARRLFLQYKYSTTAQPEKKKLQAIQEAAVQAVQENYAETPHVEAQVAMMIANQAADNDNQVSIQQVRQQLEEEYPLAAVPFDDYVEKSDVIDSAAQPVTVTPARIRRMESRSLRTANGIEVKIPTELLNAESEVEFLHADDGSISLLIKNVIL